MTPRSAAEIASIMQAICSRKEMYFQPVDPATAKTFIDGFMIGCFVFGIELDLAKAEQKRGWQFNSFGPTAQMKERGLDDNQITDELLAILSAAVSDAVGAVGLQRQNGPT